MLKILTLFLARVKFTSHHLTITSAEILAENIRSIQHGKQRTYVLNKSNFRLLKYKTDGETKMVYYPAYRKVSEPRYYIYVGINERRWFIDIDWFNRQRRTYITIPNPKSSPNTPPQCPPESGYIERTGISGNNETYHFADSIRVLQGA